MPSQITHVLGGWRSRNDASPDPAFALGCQGPDVFAHGRRTKPFALSYARLLHRRGYGDFCVSCARLLRDTQDPVLLSWFSGFLTHQALDKALHPYIVCRTPSWSGTNQDNQVLRGVSPALYHAFFERILDVLLYELYEQHPVVHFNARKVFHADPAAIDCIVALISRCLRETYPDQSATDADLDERIQNAFADTYYFYALTDPSRTNAPSHELPRSIAAYASRGASGVALLFPVALDTSIDYLNLTSSPWPDPVSGLSRRESVPELFEKGISNARIALELFASVLDGTSSCESLGDLISNDCLSIARPDGSIAVASYRRPFPLESALLQEVRTRQEWLQSCGSVDRTDGELI